MGRNYIPLNLVTRTYILEFPDIIIRNHAWVNIRVRAENNVSNLYNQ